MEATYWGAIRALWALHPTATLYAFLLPFCVSSFALMFGNW